MLVFQDLLVIKTFENENLYVWHMLAIRMTISLNATALDKTIKMIGYLDANSFKQK